ncbi:MAG: diadenylate cyclase CdaA [Clostridia bacterium]|nr:diadenylate cyclase CdaA [Clostridia bacterium]
MGAILASGNGFTTFITEYFGIDSVLDIFLIILDIAIITFLIYETIKIFKGTRAFALLKSILLILVLSFIARLLNLNAVSSLLSVILNVLPVMAVVLFAPEIRKLLEDLGNRKFTDVIRNIFRSGGAESEQRKKATLGMINETVTAVEKMSGTKTGALIVFERKNSIAEWDSQGTLLDADVSSRLLEQIFVKNTPLHDGAVLVRDGKIYAAQCVLPNTRNKNISRELGTRHMAAIGASEELDCVVVVVSEETGTVSCTEGGKIYRGLDAEALRKFLEEKLLPEEDGDAGKGGGLRKLIRKIFKKKEAGKDVEVSDES